MGGTPGGGRNDGWLAILNRFKQLSLAQQFLPPEWNIWASYFLTRAQHIPLGNRLLMIDLWSIPDKLSYHSSSLPDHPNWPRQDDKSQSQTIPTVTSHSTHSASQSAQQDLDQSVYEAAQARLRNEFSQASVRVGRPLRAGRQPRAGRPPGAGRPPRAGRQPDVGSHAPSGLVAAAGDTPAAGVARGRPTRRSRGTTTRRGRWGNARGGTQQGPMVEHTVPEEGQSLGGDLNDGA